MYTILKAVREKEEQIIICAHTWYNNNNKNYIILNITLFSIIEILINIKLLLYL